MKQKKCNCCGSPEHEERRIPYLYSYKGNYLLAPDTPVEICLSCGMLYYEAKVLKEIESRFFAIQKKQEHAENYIEIPIMSYAS
ncbi:MAG: type II toxin-antitoxin system MqsA family antitoxin [Deltaproteobacteria bacterium]|nr:MAG: type II toxin-antitoxin system MqsA family antitoxin [Deltaproteobacteria bacterium]